MNKFAQKRLLRVTQFVCILNWSHSCFFLVRWDGNSQEALTNSSEEKGNGKCSTNLSMTLRLSAVNCFLVTIPQNLAASAQDQQFCLLAFWAAGSKWFYLPSRLLTILNWSWWPFVAATCRWEHYTTARHNSVCKQTWYFSYCGLYLEKTSDEYFVWDCCLVWKVCMFVWLPSLWKDALLVQ